MLQALSGPASIKDHIYEDQTRVNGSRPRWAHFISPYGFYRQIYQNGCEVTGRRNVEPLSPMSLVMSPWATPRRA